MRRKQRDKQLAKRKHHTQAQNAKHKAGEQSVPRRKQPRKK